MHLSGRLEGFCRTYTQSLPSYVALQAAVESSFAVHILSSEALDDIDIEYGAPGLARCCLAGACALETI